MSDCGLTSPGGCVSDLVGGVVGDVAASAWDSVCRSFADAAVGLLKVFADAFVAFPNVDLSSGGIRSVYGISLWVAGIIAAMLLVGQVIRTAFTRDGSALAHGLVGVGKAALAFMLTLTVAGVCLQASDEIAVGIINRSFGSSQGLKDKLTGLFAMSDSTAPSLILILALVGILLVLVLWFEMLLRNAAVAVLIATSPIAAAGQVSEVTRAWWSKLVGAAAQLTVLKPVIALVFAVGFGLMGNTPTNADGSDIVTLLTGMLVLLLAAVAWPAIARFFTFAQVQVAGGAGLGAVLGFAAGRLGGGSGGPAGVDPGQFSQATEARTMAGMSTGSAGMGGASAAGGATAAAAVAGPLAIAVAGVDMAQRAVNSLTGRMEQMASHAGIQGANHHARPAGFPQQSGGWSTAASGSGRSAGTGADQLVPDGNGEAGAPAPATVMPESAAVEVPADRTVDLPKPPKQETA
jgi:hypothetical protein